ncbi:MAG: cell division protein SepF [Candidatus Altiarchaeota archaeon]|nr:cell division protein SepF [Candidatus Altiarchaeota archaeon]
MEKDIDIEAYLSELDIREGKIIEREDVIYIKPLDIKGDESVEEVKAELDKNNIVVANIKTILSDKLLLREMVGKLKKASTDVGGDLGRISDQKILVVPSGMKIVHRS